MMWARRGVLAALGGGMLAGCGPLQRSLMSSWTITQPLRSGFFPIGLYNVLADGEPGQTVRMANIKAAGFNTIVAWGNQDPDRLMAQAIQHDLQVIWPNPTDELARRWVGQRNLLAFEIDHEPTLRARNNPYERDSIIAFLERKSALRSMGHQIPLMTFNSPTITPPPFAEHWRGFAMASDVIGFWKYSFRPDTRSLSQERGLPEVMEFANRVANKPIWPVLQAMRSPILDWQWPSESQMAAQAMTALLHGATGLFWFSLDNAVARAGQVIGASPRPEKAYATRPEPNPLGQPPLDATEHDLRQSQETWEIMASLNSSVSYLAKTYFTLPDWDKKFWPYVDVRGSLTRAPIRIKLKPMPQHGADYILMALVNHDDAELDVTFEWKQTIAESCLMFAHETCADISSNGKIMTLKVAPYAAQTWIIRLA